MKRKVSVLIAMLSAVSLLSAQPTLAGTDARTRRVTRSYTGPGVVDWKWPTSGGGTLQLAGIEVHPRAGETRLDVTVKDSVHSKMGAYIRQSSRKGPRVFHVFCGSTARPVKIDPRRSVWIYVSTTPCGEVPGVPVSGELKLTFVNPKG